MIFLILSGDFLDTILCGKVRKVLGIEGIEGFLKMVENIWIHFEKSTNGFEHQAYLYSEDPECTWEHAPESSTCKLPDNKLIRGTYLSSNKSNLRHDNKSILTFQPKTCKITWRSPPTSACHITLVLFRHNFASLEAANFTCKCRPPISGPQLSHTWQSVEKFLEPADARRRMIRGWKESNATHVKVNANVKPKLYHNPVHFLPSFHPSFLPSFLPTFTTS